MKNITLLFWLTINVAFVQGQINPADKLPVDTAVTIGKLPNGLTYYIRPNNKPEQKVELRLVVNAGSINEDADQLGLAHMAEHMAFNGTKNFKKNDIISFLQQIGVGFGSDLNAYTSFDETIYILPIPTDKPDNLEKGFSVLEDWAHNVTYLDEDIDNERAIILEESRLGKGAGERMFKKILPKMLSGSLYAERLPIGKDSIIKNFKHDVIRRFYKDWYRPELMAVIVVGDITREKATALIVKHFGSLANPANARPRLQTPVPPYATNDALVVTDKEATGYQAIVEFPAYPLEKIITYDDYRKSLVKDLFTTM
ncbi:MAG TPA: pitrilysin family protein, partial [Agriterribacter sp.]|nr:pitrilysin family protein [Agriterribacter sp.]